MENHEVSLRSIDLSGAATQIQAFSSPDLRKMDEISTSIHVFNIKVSGGIKRLKTKGQAYPSEVRKLTHQARG